MRTNYARMSPVAAVIDELNALVACRGVFGDGQRRF
jgi:hypothetical protein